MKRQVAAEEATEDANGQQIAEMDNQEAAATADTGATAVDTTNTADTSAAANITLDETFISQALEVHNELRDLHGVPRLVHNPQLSQLAQVHADYLADNRLLVNSVKIYNGDQIGENLLYIQDANPDMYAGECCLRIASIWRMIAFLMSSLLYLLGDRATLQWYAYGKNFDFSKDFQYEATPFSQVSSSQLDLSYQQEWFKCSFCRSTRSFGVTPKKWALASARLPEERRTSSPTTIRLETSSVASPTTSSNPSRPRKQINKCVRRNRQLQLPSKFR